MAAVTEVLLTQRQEALLRELASSAGGGTVPGEGAGNHTSDESGLEAQLETQEAFYEEWFRTRTSPKRHEEDVKRSCWGSVEDMQAICAKTCEQLTALLDHLTTLEHDRLEVVRKTTALHEECEHMVHDQEQLGASAEAIAERLDLFDRVADVARFLEGSSATAHPDFGSVMDKLDGSISFLENHGDFCQAQAYLHQFEHLRNRACIAMRSAVQKSLERSQAQVEQQVREQAADGYADTQVFYARFKAAALNYKPLMALLHRRLDVHETYAVTLEELERFYATLRIRLVVLPVSTHLQSILHKELPAHLLGSATRQAATYILDLSHFERQCFEAYFEIRKPQEALHDLLETVAELFYKTMRPVVLSCESIDSLREMAHCLQMDIMEPNENSARSAELVPVLAMVYRLHKDVQEKLIYRTEIYIRTSIRGFSPTSEDLQYPALLFSLDPTSRSEPAQEELDASNGFKVGWYPSLRRTLEILAKIYQVLEMSTFQGLAQEAVDVCLVSLKSAMQLVSERSLANRSNPLEQIVRVMDSQLFLIRHLLILREQVASFECDLIVSEKYFDFSNFWEALHLKLPEGLLGILKPKLCQTQVDSKKDIDTELKNACEVLITNVAAYITQPLATLNSQISTYLAPKGTDPATLRNQAFMSLEKLRETTSAFLANVRENVPFVASHVRLYLSSMSAGGSPPAQHNAVQSTAALLFKKVEALLVDTCGRMEKLFEEQRFTMAQFDEIGFLRPAALRELVNSLFNSVMEAPWEDLLQHIRKVERAEIRVAVPAPDPQAASPSPTAAEQGAPPAGGAT